MPKKKDKVLDKDFYINEIGVLDWLKSNEPQTLRFSNRMEYKVNNGYHRVGGPAIEFFDGGGNQFYLEDKKISPEEYQDIERTRMIDKMLKNQ